MEPEIDPLENVEGLGLMPSDKAVADLFEAYAQAQSRQKDGGEEIKAVMDTVARNRIRKDAFKAVAKMETMPNLDAQALLRQINWLAEKRGIMDQGDFLDPEQREAAAARGEDMDTVREFRPAHGQRHDNLN